MLYAAATQSRVSTQQANPGRASSGRWAGQEAEGDEALGCLLPLKSPLSSSRQHPPAQRHRVRGRAFRGEEPL